MTLQSFERTLKQPKLSIQMGMLLLLSLVSLLLVSGQASAAPATFEMFAASGNTGAVGPTTASQTHTYRYNTNNPTGNAVQTVYPQPTVTYSLENQQYANGLVFGNAVNPQNSFVALATQGEPINTDFASSRNNAANPQGIDVNNNYGLRMTLVTGRLTGVRQRNTSAVNGGLGHYYGDIVMTWSRPILNPVINMSGLGGTGGSQSTFGFSAGAELFNPPAGTTISRLAGTNLSVTGLTIRNSATTIGATRTTGGASGSVQVLNANPITTLRFRLYVRSDSTSTSTDWGPNTAGVGEAFVFSSSSVDAAVGDLFVSKTNSVSTVTSGSPTTYTVRVTNNGPDTIDGAILSDVVGTGLTATSVVCSGAASNRCTTAPSLASLVGSGVALPSLASGQFYEVSLTANVTATFGSVTNNARVGLSATSTSAITGASCVTSGGITRSFNTLTGVCSSSDTDNVVVLSAPLQCESSMFALQGNTTDGFRNIVSLSPTGALGASITTVPTNGAGTGANNNAGLAISPNGTKVFVTTPQNTLRVYDVPTNTWVAEVPVPSGNRGIRATVTSDGIGYLGSEDLLWEFQTSAPYTVSNPRTITSLNGGPSLIDTNGDFFSDDNGNLFVSANPLSNGTTLNLYRVASNGNALFLGSVASPSGQYGGYAALNSGIYASAVSGVIIRQDLINLVATQTAAADPTRGNSDLASCFYPSLNPVIQALKTSTKVTGSAGAQIVAGDTLEYRIVIRNIGTLSAANVQFQDSIPAGTTYVPNSTTYNYTTATGRPQVALADVGGVMPFVTARAVGSPTAAAGVLLVDQTGAGTMAADAAQRDREVVITFRVTVDANASVVSNRGSASYISDPRPPTTTTVETDDPTTPEPNDATLTTITQNADLSITKTNNVTSVSPASAAAYTVVVTNAGPSAANGALFRDPAATGLNKTSITCTAAGGAVCPTAPISVTAVEVMPGIVIPTLPSGGSLTFVVNANVTAANGSNITNTATISTPNGVTDPNTANNTASDQDTVTAAPPPVTGLTTDQCSAANALNVITSSASTTTFETDSSSSQLTQTNTINVDANTTAQTYFGTGTNGAIQVRARMGWSPGSPVNSRNPSTLSIRVNGTVYAVLNSRPSGEVATSTRGTITGSGGATISINNGSGFGAFATTVDITGSPTPGQSQNVLRDVIINLPVSISAVTSLQVVWLSGRTPGDDISYRVDTVNQCKNRITLIKSLFGSRASTTDQFAMRIAGQNGPATTTTTGTFDTVANGSTTLYKVRGANAYTLSEAMAAGSASALSTYGTTYTCTNASTGTTTVLPSANSVGQSFALTPRAGDDITCTMTNVKAEPANRPVYQCDSNPANTVFHETFGAGTAPGRRVADLPAGVTTYTRNASANTITQVNEGEYDIVTNPDFVDDFATQTWHHDLDHTGNQHGYMGLFNATTATNGTFFYRSSPITGLQPNTRYRFKGWATNVVTSRLSGTVATPNISISVLDASSSAVISTVNSGDIAQTSPDDRIVWNEYGVEFVTGPSQTSAVIQMSNNKAAAGNGNDLAIDDLCLVRVTTDLAVTKTNITTIVDAGGSTTYLIEVSNIGRTAANGAIFRDPFATGLQKDSVSCAASGGAVCPTDPTVTQVESGVLIPTLPVGGRLTFSITATVTATTGSVTNSATITAPLGLTDIDLTNNSASDTDVINALVTISGRVFEDNSGTTTLAANAYNGLQNVGEIGLAGSTVQLNNCAGTVLATTQTNGMGDYAFSVPFGSLSSPDFCITQTNLAGYTSVSGTETYLRATDTITTSNTGLLSYANRNFGDARLALILTTDGQQTTTPSGTVSYSHILRSESALMVGAINTASTEAPLFGWTTVLYRDTNCNGTVEESDPVLTSAIGQLLPNEEVCVVQRVNAPANATNGAQHVATLSASYTATLQGGAVLNGSSNTRTDTTLVGTAGLDLRKQVRVVASCPSTGADNAAFVERNTAKNGEFLEYQIIYSNRSTRNLSQLTVRDVVPSGTTFQSATCQSTPSGSGCTAPVSAAANGDLAWSLTNIAPAATGSVRFCVRVPPLAEPPI